LKDIVELKRRNQDKPLPVIIGKLEQLRMISAWDAPELQRLIHDFWPGPLSILVPALPGLSPRIQDQQGFIAVRWTSHPIAQALAIAAGSPLVATSANPSGGIPASRPWDVEPLLRSSVELIVCQQPYPAGGLPSTVVQILSDTNLVVFREGAIPIRDLQSAGWHAGQKL
jgi:L-threonylcarbamoyladenylate synthase